MKRDKIYNEYMFDTKVENIFINEYMIVGKSVPIVWHKVITKLLVGTNVGII